MYKIVYKEVLAPKVTRFSVEAADIARARKPGQFVILRLNEEGERFPLTIVDSDEEAGTIDLIVQDAGSSTHMLSQMEVGDEIKDLLGPLGNPTEIEDFGVIVCVGGGVGTALLYPIAKAMKEAGNYVISLIGARTKELIILEEEMKEFSDEVVITTDDGSYGIHGFGSTVLENWLKEGKKIDRVVAIGPVLMMRAVANVTKPYNVKTIVSLNPIMVDGTGMCGGCRVTVGEEVKFACVDGPEFDGHLVDFEELMTRQSFYKEEEQCRLDAVIKREEEKK